MRYIVLFCLLSLFCHLTKPACVHRGQCPVYKVHCDLVCAPETAVQQCKNDSSCCTEDKQCPRQQKCCQPECGCYNRCVNATNVTS